MDAVKTLLDRYGIADPAAGNDNGKFTNADLQALYDVLSAQGQASLAEALKVGALIEEVDIADLIEELAEVEHSDIQRVYGQLLQGSENHLRAFVVMLRAVGWTAWPRVWGCAPCRSRFRSHTCVGAPGTARSLANGVSR